MDMHIITYQLGTQLDRESPNESIGPQIREYTSQVVPPRLSLVLVTAERMTWGMWRSAFTSMQVLSDEAGRWPKFSFSIKNQAYGDDEIGWGLLKETR